MLLACEKKQPPREQRSNAEMVGEWLYDNNCAECHENPQPDLHKQPPNLHGRFVADRCRVALRQPTRKSA
jgi:cytochrome c2